MGCLIGKAFLIGSPSVLASLVLLQDKVRARGLLAVIEHAERIPDKLSEQPGLGAQRQFAFGEVIPGND